MSAEPTAGRQHLDDVGARRDRRGLRSRDRPEQVGRGHAARLGRAGAGRERRIEHVDVDRHEHRPLADVRERPRHDLADPEVAHVVHEEARDPALGCQSNSAARASSRAGRSGRSAPGTRPASTSRYIGVPCETSTPNTSVPVSVCVSKWIKADRAALRAAHARCHGSAIEWSPPSVIGITPASTTSPTSLLDRRVRFATGSAGTTGASP
jgi:hypothetical protein